MEIERIFPETVSRPLGHYAPATCWGQLVFASGHLPTSAGQSTTGDPFKLQAVSALNNLLSTLQAAGATPASVLKVNAWIVGIDHWNDFNDVFAGIFGPARPARAVVPVSELHHGYLVEVDAIAVRECA